MAEMSESNNSSNLKYKKKLELSYRKCVEELFNPCDDWEDKIKESKFIINPETGSINNKYTFIINHKDDIHIPDVEHTYVFRRSKFYDTFARRTSRLKRDLIKYWRSKNYYVDFFLNDETKKWNLVISWENQT